MKLSKEQDLQKLNSILKTIENISKCFEQHKINNSNNLKNDEIAQAACTQFITNIYECKKKLTTDTFNELVELNKIKVAGARHVASHDYDSVNFIVVYSICNQLNQEVIISELNRTIAKTKGELSDENGN